jgi:hypothetical protein
MPTLNYQLISSTKQFPTWETNSRSEISQLPRNPKFPNCIFKVPPLISILSHLNPVLSTHPISPSFVLLLYYHLSLHCQSQLRRNLWRGSAAVRLVGLRVRIPSAACMSLPWDCCILSGRGLCDGPITYPGSPIECGVSECDLETSTLRRPRTTLAVEPWKKKSLQHFKSNVMWLTTNDCAYIRYRRIKMYWLHISQMVSCLHISRLNVCTHVSCPHKCWIPASLIQLSY